MTKQRVIHLEHGWGKYLDFHWARLTDERSDHQLVQYSVPQMVK